ncbi:fumarylacetoacetate hydrolase domain-containing protein 2 [Nematostella vectensis]|uniref:fumarylacetoacetate hydrolase domain-containing protein 2 n=1 Tax=Nematostella vectensis TaxID=45351 RepID=UPI00138FEADD|nr:fumarylacetoacetate hydrolase domain-containing protein 2 [Nematostella vectensis]
MRLVQFEEGGRLRVGVELSDGGDVVDISTVDNSIPTDMRSFLEEGGEALEKARRAVESGKNVLQRSNLKLKAPIYNPEKIICTGMNYADHCYEQNMPIPTEPVIFSKFASAIAAPGDPIPYGTETEELDFEVELAFVIGKTGKNIKEEDAMDYVAGYTVAHDVSARDWQLKKNAGQWLLGKTGDAYLPLGPAIVTKDAIPDCNNLGVRCIVNDKVMQESNTKNFVFTVPKLVAFISRFFTIKPGDVVITGTPPGVGCFRKPPIYLKKGDVVKCEIDELGRISNRVE